MLGNFETDNSVMNQLVADHTDGGLSAIASDGTRTTLTTDGDYLGMWNQRVYYSQGNGQNQITIFSVRYGDIYPGMHFQEIV